ncbi:MAG: preprotein translocase subunit SecG [Candidatus Rokuibacteriota bacterium]|nr:MAG: preprotein translocase subunit SecG [Candidatus Rokubacteria bacterium]
MYIALSIIHVLACFGIIGIVLLQSGKGADIGSAFGGAGSQAVFGSMGTPTLLGKITTGIAIVFTITSFTLAILGGERASSVVREAAPPPASAPAPAGPGPAAPAETTPTTPAAPASPAPPSQPR